MALNKIREKINENKLITGTYFRVLYLLPKKYGRKLLFKITYKKNINLSHPKDLDEKINWLIVNEHGPKEGKLADKYLVKKIIKNKNIPDLYIPKTYKIYKNAEEIDLEELPDKFVLKCNHASGGTFICTNKKDFDLNTAKTELNKQLKLNFAKVGLEYHYKYIEPVIMAEEYLDDSINERPLDYKFHCFNGKADCIMLCSNREYSVKYDFYDLEWNLLLEYTTEEFQSNNIFEKPKNLNKMIEIAEVLSKDHYFVRVDLYEINDKIYFGELTFTEQNGRINFCTQYALDTMGDKLKLPID